MPWTQPATWVNGQLVAAADLQVLTDDLTSGVMRPLAESVLTVASSTFNFASIPATFRGLALCVIGSSDAATGTVNMQLRFNTDSGASYSYGGCLNSAASAAGFEGLAQTSMLVGKVSGTTGSGSAMGVTWITIPHYLGVIRYKGVGFHGGHRVTDSSGGVVGMQGYGTWQSTAAINQVTLSLSSGNWAIGSAAQLYGLPGLP